MLKVSLDLRLALLKLRRESVQLSGEPVALRVDRRLLRRYLPLLLRPNLLSCLGLRVQGAKFSLRRLERCMRVVLGERIGYIDPSIAFGVGLGNVIRLGLPLLVTHARSIAAADAEHRASEASVKGQEVRPSPLLHPAQTTVDRD